MRSLSIFEDSEAPLPGAEEMNIPLAVMSDSRIVGVETSVTGVTLPSVVLMWDEDRTKTDLGQRGSEDNIAKQN
jgi:hypothetical protein